MPTLLTLDIAERLAAVVLAHIGREYPHKLDHVLFSDDDAQTPRALHPVFHGSFDWHSNVHAFWTLARLRRLHPDGAFVAAVHELFDARLTADAVAAECAYASHAGRGGFERPYGWAWMLALSAELHRHDSESGKRWAASLRDLVEIFRNRMLAYLPRATYPVRVGTHANTAFALALGAEYAATFGDEALRAEIADSARRWYGADVNCQAWEPNGEDFLSSALIEAECMRRVLHHDAFSAWLGTFLPALSARQPATLFSPAQVSDRTDGKIAHLDGLNLSRAWCWRALASTWSVNDARRGVAEAAAQQHIDVSLPHIDGDYAGSHWLPTFALMALGESYEISSDSSIDPSNGPTGPADGAAPANDSGGISAQRL